MLKFFYKLKRRKGAVLFIVIGFMTLLIAMASTAYFTARNSYRTVISNYNFEQLYLSTISVSDILINAAVNTPSDTTSGNNDFSGLKNALKNYLRGTPTEAESVGAIYGSTSNITGYNGSTSTESIFNQIYSGQSAIEGVIDGITIKIDFDHMDSTPTGSVYEYVNGTDHYDAQNYDTKWYMTLETTGYFKNNTVTVTDTVLHNGTIIKYTPKSSLNPPNPKPGTGGFDTFFTATGQEVVVNPDGTYDFGKTNVRGVLIKTHEITDDAYFENEYTIFMDGNNNDFRGGIATAGSLYFDKVQCHIPEAKWDPNVVNDDGTKGAWTERNDWFIKNDLVISKNSNHAVDLKNNDLVIGGDLIIYGDGTTITARNIYVMGDLIYAGGATATIQGNLYVSGNIYTDIPADTETSQKNAKLDEVRNLSGITSLVEKDLSNVKFVANPNMTDKDKEENPAWANAGVHLNGSIISSSTSITNTLQTYNRGTWNEDVQDITYKMLHAVEDAANSSNSHYEAEYVTGQTVEQALETKGATHNYESKTVTDEDLLDNALTIDLNNGGLSLVPIGDDGTGSKVETGSTLGSLGQVIKSSTTAVTNSDGSFTYTETTYAPVAIPSSVPDWALNNALSNGSASYWDNSVPNQWGGYGANVDVYVTKTATGITVLRKVGSTVLSSDDAKIETVFINGQSYICGSVIGTSSYKVSGDGNSRQFQDGSTVTKSGDNYTFKLSDGTTAATMTKSGNSYTVDINYNADGYLLNLQNADQLGGNSAKINIHTENDQTMPIALAANFNDGSDTETDIRGNNAFSWKGSSYGSDGYLVSVSLVNKDGSASAKGNVTFELGNYDKTSGDYVAYDLSARNDIETATLYNSGKTSVGTKKQTDEIGDNKFQDESLFKGWMQSSDSSDPKTDYENRIIVLSNKYGDVAVDGTIKDNTLCGYVYAPNAIWEGMNANGGNSPLFGGLIVSTYSADLGHFVYAEPNPSIVSSLLSVTSNANGNVGGGGSSNPVPGPTPSGLADTIIEGSFENTNGTKYYLG